MQIVDQSIQELLGSLSPLDVDWMDEIAQTAIAKLTAIVRKPEYTRDDVAHLLEDDFEEGRICCRLFLGLSKDSMDAALRDRLGPGVGVKRFETDREAYLDALEDLGLLDQMAVIINHQPIWSDILVERLRSGRGSAISGQKRGRNLEDFAETVVKEVFGEGKYQLRCTFSGTEGKVAKCDIAVPDKVRPRILIESKGYGATGSKMTDIIGDLDAIIAAKRHDTVLLFITDGLTWRARTADLAKIVRRQNNGEIARIYTVQMRDQLLADLQSLKATMGL